MNQVEEYIRKAADQVQVLVDAEFAKCGWSPESDSALNQAGLRDGKAIVLDYLHHGEAGVAFEHLVYMVCETGISLSSETRDGLRKVGSVLRIDIKI